MDRRGSNPQSPHPQCGAFPLSYGLHKSVWGLGGRRAASRLPLTLGDKSDFLKIQNPKSKIWFARGRIRTFINLFLRQAPLPVGLRVRTNLGIGNWDFGFGVTAQIPIPNSKWLREKDSNLYLLVQSQLSCRLDDPERFLIFELRFSIAKAPMSENRRSKLDQRCDKDRKSQFENRKSLLRLFSFQTSKVKERLRVGSSNDPGVTAPKSCNKLKFVVLSFDVSGAGTPLPLC